MHTKHTPNSVVLKQWQHAFCSGICILQQWLISAPWYELLQSHPKGHSLTCPAVDAGCWLGTSDPLHVLSPCGLGWAFTQCGGWLPKASAPKKPGRNRNTLSGLASEVTQSLLSHSIHQDNCKILPGFKSRGNGLHLFMGECKVLEVLLWSCWENTNFHSITWQHGRSPPRSTKLESAVSKILRCFLCTFS